MYTLQEIDSTIRKSVFAIDFKKEPSSLYEPLEYMIAVGGKRLRPRLCLTTFTLFKDNIDNNIILPALALELFHSFTLMHDDIMDNADIRRGVPTVRKKWSDNCAVLSGDAMTIVAYQFLQGYKGPEFQRIIELFTETAIKVIEGQQYDMDFEGKQLIVMDDYLKMIGLKTAALIACSAKMGAVIAGASDQICDALYEFGWNLGMAFQITDDYLDTFGDPAIFGKKIGGDIENNKKTWLLVKCQKLATGEDRPYLENLLAQTEDMPAKVAAMQALYKKLKVDSQALDAIGQYHEKALSLLQDIGLDRDQRACLTEFARGMVYRRF
ncbi:MAG: polyprenyl synthetase family protein [Bacteroidales bacterium]|nr:polyprenyl synthetase family protein [Bacteroidales bacterium]